MTADLVAELATGERRPLARLLTRIESGDPALRPLLPELFAAGKGGQVVGITGPPGSGKSTLVNALIGEWRRRGRRVGVLAVDPSSPYTGGAIMGDRIRMMEHHADRDVFMRSMASRGELGGLAATTWIAAAALDAAGFDPILVETVGAGQSEVEIARLAETTVVVEVPEMGDEVQAIKAGLLEVADVIAVNKGDRPGAERAARQLRAMLSTAGGRVQRQPPKVMLTTATTGEGVGALADAVDAHRAEARSPERALQRATHQLDRAIADLAQRRAAGSPGWEDTARQVADRSLDPMTAAERLLESASHDSRSARQMAAMDEAVRGISGTLDLDSVLQGIVDRVRELVEAQYAALGIVDESGVIQQFITSGISDEQRRAIGELPRGRGLLGLIIRENRSYRIKDIGSHPESYGFPPNHPPMASFLGVPISARSATIGRLYLTNKAGGPFTAADQALVEMFARHAAIAIENATLHRQVRRLAVVDERERISRDMHDSVIQVIYGVTLSLDDVPELVSSDPNEVAGRVDRAIDALHAVIRDIRNFIFGLRPVLLDEGGLAQGLRTLGDELRRSAAVEVEVEADDVDDLPVPTIVELLSIAREALSNIARHSGAGTARLSLSVSDAGLGLDIRDDGRGFDVRTGTGSAHQGLANMERRARSLGGEISVTSRPDAGTHIIVNVPRRR